MDNALTATICAAPVLAVAGIYLLGLAAPGRLDRSASRWLMIAGVTGACFTWIPLLILEIVTRDDEKWGMLVYPGAVSLLVFSSGFASHAAQAVRLAKRASDLEKRCAAMSHEIGGSSRF